MKEAHLKPGIVRILGQNGKTAGTGFIAHDKKGLVATCAHVVRFAGSEPGGTIELMFDDLQERQSAKVEPEYWRDPDVGDVAILRLKDPLPDRVQPILLG